MGLRNKNIDLTPIWDKAPRKQKIKNSERIIPKEKIIKDLTPVWDKKPKGKYKVKTEKPKKDLTLFELYKEKVYELTEQNKYLIEGIEKRAWRNHHIDHKLSIQWGFSNNIPPEHIAHIDNLRMLWWEDNMNKNISCFVDDKNKWICGDLKIYPLRD